MGLISKTAKVKWNGNNRKYYEFKGYVFTKINNEFKVNVADLTEGSHVLVDVSCDCEDCTTPIEKPIKWQNYRKNVKEDGKYYCNKCAMKLYGGEKTRVTKLQSGKSFEQWCLENNRQDVLDRWDCELNVFKPSEIGYSSDGKNRKGFYFKCPKGVHQSELKSVSDFTRGCEGSIECKACNSFAQYETSNLGQDFLGLYWNYEINNELGIDPWEISYGSQKKIWIKCQNKNYHGSYEVNCKDFTNGSRCPYCSNRNGKVHKFDSLGILYSQVFNTWSGKNKKTPYEYLPNSNKKVWWKCPDGKHKDYLRSIQNSNTLEFRCPKCTQEKTESLLQEKVRLYLEELGYEVLHEKYCTLNPKNIIQPPNNSNKKRGKGTLRYDNEIIINNIHIMIEVMGSQHYQITFWHENDAEKYKTTPELELKYQQDKDKYKKEYALSKGYEYLEIPYWVDDENETYKKLIDNKINEILNESKLNEVV